MISYCIATESTQLLPSLMTPGQGLFDTHVTWADIEKNMQSSLGTIATFGENKTAANIGDGNGFLSKICLIEPNWQNASKGEELPMKVVAKICTLVDMHSQKAMVVQAGQQALHQWIEAMNQLDSKIKGMHNSEANVYKLFEKYGLQEKMATTKIYHYQKFTEDEPDRGHLLMEYVDDLAPVHISDNLPVEALHQPLRSLAAMAVASLRFTEEEKSLFRTKPFTEVFGGHFGEGNIHMFTPGLKTFGEGRLTANIDILVANKRNILDLEKYDRIPDELGMRKVHCHGDLWSTNVLWRKHEEKHQMAAIIDYQTAHFGSPSIDLCRYLITSLSGKERRKHTNELLETYYKYLLKELDDDKAPFSFEQLKRSYEICFPIAGYMVLPMISSMEELIEKNSNLEAKEKLKELVYEKADCLLEDILHYSGKQDSF